MESTPFLSVSHAVIELKNLIEHRLRELLPLSDQNENVLTHAMHEGVLAPGKRTRALLMLLTARSLGGNLKVALDLACGVEMVHTASLYLDDMPCMDNAQLRRGRLAAHVRYGEDVAVLAAVSLLSEAYLVITNIEELPAQLRSRLVGVLSRAVGRQGLANGQYLDLHAAPVARGVEGIARVNEQKTGVLFSAALDMAALAAQADDDSRQAIRAAAKDIGQAFQLRDDLEVGVPSSEIPLKDRHQDKGKMTMLSLLGRKAVQYRMKEHLHQAVEHLRLGMAHDTQVADFVLQAFEVHGEEVATAGMRDFTNTAPAFSMQRGVG